MDVCVCVWEMVEKDLKMELDVALAWVVNAKNCQQSHFGYDSIQLVLGFHTNLSSVMLKQLSVLEEAKVIDTVIDHLNASHAARRAFIRKNQMSIAP